MDREKVMEMTSDELRINAAELGGWTEIVLEDGYPIGIPPCWKDQLPPGKTTKVDLPDYPNDIAAAWELWERLPKERMLYDFEDYICCSVGGYLGGRCMTEGEANTAPRAITRAFILVMIEEDK